MTHDLARPLSEAIGVIAEQLRLRFAAAHEQETDLGFVALATLRHLVRHGPRTVTELAEIDKVTTQAISLRVGPLVENGLVKRQRDPQDGRRTILSPSPAGMDMVAHAHGRAHQALIDAVASLSPTEQETVRQALPALKQLGSHLRETPDSL